MSHKQEHSRRTVLKVGGSVAIGGFLSSGAVSAQTDLPLEIEQNAEEEYVVIRNTGDEEVDITGYSINFEAGEDSNVDQIRELDGEVIIGPGEEVTVATGDETTIDADVELVDPYDGFVLNDEDPDVIALVDENENFVTASDDTHQYNGDGDGDDETDDGDDETDDETHTLTVVVTDMDGVRIEGVELSLSLFEGGAEQTGTTDECGEVQFEVEDGTYEAQVSAGTGDLAQSSANRLVGVDGEDETFVINLYEPNEEEEPAEEQEDITEPEPCEAGEEEDEEPTDDDEDDTDPGDDDEEDPGAGEDPGDDDDEDPGDRGDTDTDDDGDDDEDAAATGDEKKKKDEKDDDCPKR